MNTFQEAMTQIKEARAQGFVAVGRSASGYWWLREIMKVDGQPMTDVALLESRMAVHLLEEALQANARISEFAVFDKE